MSTLTTLEETIPILTNQPLPRARRIWSGADVVIANKVTQRLDEGSFYPDPRYVVTPHAAELSWLFERLRDAFYDEQRLDSCSKIEFFGRLANAALRCIRKKESMEAEVLCRAVLHEAFAIYEEMEEGTFTPLAVASGGEIYDDYVDEAIRTGYLGSEETLKFLKQRGLEVNRD
jgi:hypothetical protein